MAERFHAREAVRLLKLREKQLQQTESGFVHFATGIALDLQDGKIPDWYYSLIENNARRNRQTSSSEQTLTNHDAHEEEEIVELSSSGDEKGSLRTPTGTAESARTQSKWNSNKLTRRNLFSVGTLTRSGRSENRPAEEQRLPSSGVMNATRSPPPNLELPLITDTFRRSFTLSAVGRRQKRRSNLPSTAIGLRSKRISCPKKKSGKEVEVRMKRKNCVEDAFEMDEKSKIFSEYWQIPFDPFRGCVLTDHKIFKNEKAEFEDEEDISLNKKQILVDTDYWEIRKIMRFVRIGNPTATALALCALKELDIQKPSCNEIIRHLHGISLFLNILDTDNRRCRVASLKVLVCLARSPKTSNIILKRNGIQQLVLVLTEDDKVVVTLACDVLSLLAKHSNVRVVANKMNIVEKLMSVFQVCVKQAFEGVNLELLRSVCKALWSCCRSVRNRDAKKVSESLDVISHLVETQDESLVVPLLGIVEECTDMEYFRGKLEKENFIEKVMSKMESGERIKVLSVKILFKCASDEKSQKTLMKPYNMQEIMKLFTQNCQGINNELLTLLLGIIWRCSLNKEHRQRFENHGVFSHMLNILKSDKSIQVKSAALGVLSEFLWDETYTNSIGNHEVVNLLIDFTSLTEPAILVNSARSLGVCARIKVCRKAILQLDGLRLLWSLLKSSDEEVIASGAVALASVCACPEESANAVRSIVGGIELLMTLLAGTELTEYKVLICLCEAAVSIAKDTENRSILTDYDLISVLLRLCESESKMLRYYVTCLISRCCESTKERSVLSQCIPYLIQGLGDGFDDHVHCASICALNKLSHDFANCVFLRKDNTTKILMNLLASSNERIQEAAAGCLANVRKSVMQVSNVG